MASVTPLLQGAVSFGEAETPDVESAAGGAGERERMPPVILRMPNTAFGMAMGLAGHAIMWKGMKNAPFLKGVIAAEAMGYLNLTFWCLSAGVGGLVALAFLYKVFTSFPIVLAEDRDPVRVHFFNAPNMVFIMLLIGLPPQFGADRSTVRILWVLALVYQIFMTQHIYKGWFFDSGKSFTQARPQFLLSTVGWFLLSVLGSAARVKEEWGVGLPVMCLGAGLILYLDVVVFIFQSLHTHPELRGQPAMFLLIAPPSVGVVALDLAKIGSVDGGFSPFAEMLLGWVYVILMLLLRLGPQVARDPAILGEYWAYVFPLGAAAAATIRYASVMDTMFTAVIAYIVISLAILALVVVAGRTLFHCYECVMKKEEWKDSVYLKERYDVSISAESLRESLRDD